MPASLLSSSALSQLLCRPRAALGVFVPAGLSDVADEAGMLDDLSRSGAALFEIGAPAADPVLDGPVIASAYRQALRRGTDLTRLQQTVEHASALAPTVVVAYWSSLQQHGVRRFAGRLAAAGACGVMVPDLPADQAVAWHQTTGSVGLLAPALVPRQMPEERLGEVAAAASGWLYAPANAGPTGYRGPLDTPALAQEVGRLRAVSTLPIVSGIGVSTPAKAAAVAPLVDAVIIGTPIVRALTTTPHNAPQLVADFAASVTAHQVHRG
ncbi:tryptophan synthase subunit alpha [Streptomyces albulus]|uniref:tryptophan synthase subunit alpha n=1 Tax=Streptomyces noursei TaxID=1971 RepID=UPI001F15A893|nr:tryptophan synthase subunit alpha [Streptomyces noursei]MCE4948409.1 tryptophan synthase subunit alpha [Streptomyces noursei]